MIRARLSRPRPDRLRDRVRRWLLEEPAGPTAAERARIATILMMRPPH